MEAVCIQVSSSKKQIKTKHCTSGHRLVLLQNTATQPIRSQDQTQEAGQVECLQHFLRYTRVRAGQEVGGQAAASTGHW